MSEVHKLEMKTTTMPTADRAFLDWFDMTMALPHDYMEEIFRVYVRNTERAIKRNGVELTVAERI